jgi:hypothetical protein
MPQLPTRARSLPCRPQSGHIPEPIYGNNAVRLEPRVHFLASGTRIVLVVDEYGEEQGRVTLRVR